MPLLGTVVSILVKKKVGCKRATSIPCKKLSGVKKTNKVRQNIKKETNKQRNKMKIEKRRQGKY
jgi:hypothetical protein